MALACFLFKVDSSLEAAYLHALIVGDTIADDIGPTVEPDIINIQQELTKVAKATQLIPHFIILKDKQANPKMIAYHLNQLKVSSQDVVVTYYSCHGFRTSDKSDIWPHMDFTSTDTYIDFNWVNHVVLGKKPRLFISIADCCNNVIPHEWLTRGTLGKPEKVPSLSSKEIQNYKKLFLESSGFIILSAAMPGLYSIGEDERGGIYTNAFLRSLRQQVKLHADWHVIITKAHMSTVRATEGTNTPQVPQHWMFVK